MSLKALLRSLLRKSGFDIVRYVPELNRPLAILPMIVRERVSSGEPFFFAQIGANDGVLDDPLRDLVRRYRLPGLLVEPLPDIFEKLKSNYRDQPQLLFENVAVLNAGQFRSIYRVRGDAAVPRHWHGIAAFARENLVAQGVPVGLIETVPVPAASLRAIFAKHGIERLSLLQVDTEGYDFEVIRSAFDAKIFPDVINYEHCWLVPNIRFKCKQMLDMHGYRFIEAGKDTLAIRQVG